MIETERLILRHWRATDAADLYRYASDPRVSEMALWPRHESIEMSLMVIRDFFSPNPHCFAMTLKDTGQPIGCIGLVPQGEENYCVSPAESEAGYWIGHEHWGHGLTSEALHGLVGYCRDVLGLKSLLITADARNTASHRVAEKCGFTLVGNYMHDDVESVAYRLILA